MKKPTPRAAPAGTPLARAKRRGMRKPAAAPVLRDVTVDDVLKDLLQLFRRLGLNAGHLVTRVKGLDALGEPLSAPFPHSFAISDLLTLWHRDPAYLDATGAPLPVKMRAARRSFRDLAARSVPDMPANRLLGELERLRAIRIDKNGLIHVRVRALNIFEDKRLAALHTLNSLRGFINTLGHNLHSRPSNANQLFHRIAWNGELDAATVAQMKIWLRRHGQNFLESADIWMMNKAGAARGKRRRRLVQASVGVYLAVEKP